MIVIILQIKQASPHTLLAERYLKNLKIKGKKITNLRKAQLQNGASHNYKTAQNNCKTAQKFYKKNTNNYEKAHNSF